MTNAVIFSGSFNPIHVGHVVMANYVVELTSANELWFVVSPHNPHKDKSGLVSFEHRLNMVKLAFKDLNLPVIVSDIEQLLPRPSYTVNTLEALSEKYPDKKWSLLIGADNLANFHLWKDYRDIINKYQLLVYPRPDADNKNLYTEYNALELTDAPLMEISSTFIRESIKSGLNVAGFLPAKVSEYIAKHKLYTE